MTIFYKLADKLYINITNRCSCDCTFCIRKSGDSVGDADSLWLEHEPSLTEIKSDFAHVDLDGVSEIVFCGYGEPMERAEDVIQIASYIKESVKAIPLRLNTNGLVKLIRPEFDLDKLKILDSVSISLNADNKLDYQSLTRSKFGEISFESLLTFAKEIKDFTTVFFTVVDTPDFKVDIEKCRKLSDDLGIELRVRKFGM